MNTMKRQIFLLGNLLNKILNKYLITILLLIFCISKSYANEKWFIDKNISKISFEVPVLFATNVKGEFKSIEGFVDIDLENKKNNKALLSVSIDSIEFNYEKYRNLLLSPIFFYSAKYPLGVIDTKKFAYDDEDNLELDIELTIKDISKNVKTKLKIKKITNDIVQIFGLLEFSRNDFNIGTGSWSNTSILKDQIKVETNIFLIKE